MSDIPIHYVGTIGEAEELVRSHDRFFVCNCGCREGRGGCARSRMDVCLMFSEDDQGSGSGLHESTREEAEKILEEARRTRLVARPFRNKERTAVDGICFCCDDCCTYFLDPQEKCDKGRLAEKTDMEKCTHCGICPGACYFGVRTMEDGRLRIHRDGCYGCGLCADVCPESCIALVDR